MNSTKSDILCVIFYYSYIGLSIIIFCKCLVITTYMYKLDMINIDRQLIPSFWPHKIAFFYLRINIATLMSIFQYCVSNKHLLCQILLYTMYIAVYQKIDPKIAIAFFNNKNVIFIDFLCDFMRQKHGITIFQKKISKSIISNIHYIVCILRNTYFGVKQNFYFISRKKELYVKKFQAVFLWFIIKRTVANLGHGKF